MSKTGFLYCDTMLDLYDDLKKRGYIKNGRLDLNELCDDGDYSMNFYVDKNNFGGLLFDDSTQQPSSVLNIVSKLYPNEIFTYRSSLTSCIDRAPSSYMKNGKPCTYMGSEISNLLTLPLSNVSKNFKGGYDVDLMLNSTDIKPARFSVGFDYVDFQSRHGEIKAIVYCDSNLKDSDFMVQRTLKDGNSVSCPMKFFQIVCDNKSCLLLDSSSKRSLFRDLGEFEHDSNFDTDFDMLL